MFHWLTALACFAVSSDIATGVRVCPTIGDYNWPFNLDCYENPVVDENITEIIQSWGFTAEEHYLTTDDGYRILLERAYSTITKKNPIIIVHGIGMNALSWVNRGKSSLAYLLGNMGYDVWMLNYRGTWYSKSHVSLSFTEAEYWKFNINEMGIYDVRATVKHVNEKTGQKPIYIGYSMGSTGFFIYSTTYPEEAEEYVQGMIGLAPVINYKDVKSVAKYLSPVWSPLKKMVYFLWDGEILRGYSSYLKYLVQFSPGIEIVQSVINLLMGDDYDQLDAINFPLLTQIVDTAGVEVFTHYLQIYEADIFQKYDHGPAINLEIYGSESPPAYNMSKVPVPVALIVGSNDWLATPTNAQQIYAELSPLARCGYTVIESAKWSHFDFLAAKDLVKKVYVDLFNKIEQIESGKCEF